MFRSLLRILGIESKPVPTKSSVSSPMADADYTVVREVLKKLSSQGKYFAYCPDDDTLIWHEHRGVWRRDDDGSRFIAFAAACSTDRHARLTLNYFKNYCVSSRVDASLKAKRLSRVE